MCNCNNYCHETKPEIKFFNDPENVSWISSNPAETTLFEETLDICEKSHISVESTIAAELIADGNNDDPTYNCYKLYVNDKIVSRAGYETGYDSVNVQSLPPRLETSSLTWSGTKCKKITVKLTAQVIGAGASAIDNKVSEFKGSKGAFMRIITIPNSFKDGYDPCKTCNDCPRADFFNNPQRTSWTQTDGEVTLFKKSVSNNQFSLFFSIATEMNFVSAPFLGTAYNIYRLYVDDKLVAQSGYQGSFDMGLTLYNKFETSTLAWSGCAKDGCSCYVCCYKNVNPKIKIKVTVELISELNFTSDVNNLTGNFQGCKGAFLRVLSLSQNKNECCDYNGPKTLFFNKPKTLRWVPNDGEVDIFNEKVKLGKCGQLSIDSTLAVESEFREPTTAYNTYKLYIDGKQVGVAGYEPYSLAADIGPKLETSALIYGGQINKCGGTVHIRITAQLVDESGHDIAANIDNEQGNFDGAKGAFLSVLTL